MAPPRQLSVPDAPARAGARVRCDKDGVKQVKVSWAEPRSRFTLLFERFAIDVLWETDILGAARILDISWDEAHGIMERAVARGMRRREHTVPEYIGLDEKAIARGHTYATIVCDLGNGRVIDVAPTGPPRACTAALGPSRSTSWPASRPWPWTCGSRSSMP